MKRILLACCMIAASCSFSYAQNAAPLPQNQLPAVSKTEYTSQVTQLNTLISTNKMDAAKTKWDEVHRAIQEGLRVTKYKIRDAQVAHNDADVKKYTEVMMKQRDLYSTILKLKEDMATNKTLLNDKLKEFGATIPQ